MGYRLILDLEIPDGLKVLEAISDAVQYIRSVDINQARFNFNGLVIYVRQSTVPDENTLDRISQANYIGSKEIYL